MKFFDLSMTSVNITLAYMKVEGWNVLEQFSFSDLAWDYPFPLSASKDVLAGVVLSCMKVCSYEMRPPIANGSIYFSINFIGESFKDCQCKSI